MLILKFEQVHLTLMMCQKFDRMANDVDLKQTACGQFELGLHYLFRSVELGLHYPFRSICLNIYGKYGCLHKHAICYEGVSINNQPIPFPMYRDGHDFLALFQYMLYMGTKLHTYQFIL